MILFPEMSVDSDRDSVIESEDGKESVVRLFSFSFIVLFKVTILTYCTIKGNFNVYFYLFNSAQMMTSTRRRTKATKVFRRYS